MTGFETSQISYEYRQPLLVFTILVNYKSSFRSIWFHRTQTSSAGSPLSRPTYPAGPNSRRPPSQLPLPHRCCLPAGHYYPPGRHPRVEHYLQPPLVWRKVESLRMTATTATRMRFRLPIIEHQTPFQEKDFHGPHSETFIKVVSRHNVLTGDLEWALRKKR